MVDRISIETLREKMSRQPKLTGGEWPAAIFMSPQDTAVLVLVLVDAVEAAQRFRDRLLNSTVDEEWSVLPASDEWIELGRVLSRFGEVRGG